MQQVWKRRCLQRIRVHSLETTREQRTQCLHLLCKWFLQRILLCQSHGYTQRTNHNTVVCVDSPQNVDRALKFTEIKFICSQAFSMKMHDLWNIITGDIPYQCKMCEMGVTNRSTLKTHKKKHMVDKPYVCPDCEKYFLNLSILAVHKKIHMPQRP